MDTTNRDVTLLVDARVVARQGVVMHCDQIIRGLAQATLYGGIKNPPHVIGRAKVGEKR